eukprot:CAMPEP_0183703412 /NCGR_PEP_ID=MMETSP0737-20130205/1162_1 /TAXON_ID=385413 /ORGANISM="Thalassiosira miniscula, Strain CCMP1093" /LENGTH=580 /DNA_ID=CAMNT_0025930159 /DNA_START=29 /DNA_END=1771 /DNA_ORIENTATION=+
MVKAQETNSPWMYHESFRFRAAILDPEESSATTSRGRSDFLSSLGSVDEDSALVAEFPTASARTAPNPAADRTSLLNYLRRASTSPVVTNDFRLLAEETEEGEEGEESGDEKGASEDDVEMSIQPRSISIQPRCIPRCITDTPKRNAGPYTIIAFVNSASGGRMGDTLHTALQSHLGPSYVIDLHSCRPGNMPEDTLLQYALDPMVRVLACGGDGTCGWIFSSMDKVWSTVLGVKSTRSRVHQSKYKDHLPLAIMPLGTGNDLSRQYGWGGEFQSHMKSKSMITAVQTSKIVKLDRWRCIIMSVKEMTDEEKECIPKILAESSTDDSLMMDNEDDDDYTRRATVDTLHSLLDDGDINYEPKNSQSPKKSKKKEPAIPPETQLFDGVFCNYFSLGFDAKVAYLFHHERELHPERFTSPLKNKIIYGEKIPYCLKGPKLSKYCKVLVNNEKGQLVRLKIPKSCRAIILMNIQSYGGGHRLTACGCAADSLIEVIFVSNAMRLGACFVKPSTSFSLLKAAAQTNNVCIRTRRPLHCEVDGEPWLQGEGVMQIKFHSRNSILEKTKVGGLCGCMGGGAEEAVIQ